jgi:hypothetical protein
MTVTVSIADKLKGTNDSFTKQHGYLHEVNLRHSDYNFL